MSERIPDIEHHKIDVTDIVVAVVLFGFAVIFVVVGIISAVRADWSNAVIMALGAIASVFAIHSTYRGQR